MRDRVASARPAGGILGPVGLGGCQSQEPVGERRDRGELGDSFRIRDATTTGINRLLMPPAGPSVGRPPAHPGVPASCRPGRSGRRGPPAAPPRRPGAARGTARRPGRSEGRRPAGHRDAAGHRGPPPRPTATPSRSACRAGRPARPPGTARAGPAPSPATMTATSAAVTRTLTTPRSSTSSTTIAAVMGIPAWLPGPPATLKRSLTR